jgi:hypothetical protein
MHLRSKMGEHSGIWVQQFIAEVPLKLEERTSWYG